MPGAVPDLKNWVQALVSTSTYAERSWRDLSKGRWEAKNHGLGKDAVLRPLSNEEEISASVPKPAKENKRKRASVPEDPKPKKRMACKPNKNVIPLTVESVLRLRDEDDEEEEENDESALAVRMKRTTDASSPVGSMMLHEATPRTEDIPEKDSGRVPELSDIEDASHRSRPAGSMTEEALEPLRTEENAPGDSFGAAAVEDSPTFPAFSTGVIREAQALGALDLNRPHNEEDPFRDLFISIEDVAGAGDESDLFHGLRQALNQAATVHREQCSRSQNELHRYEANLQRATDERNSLRLSIGQREEEIKDLRAKLAKACRDQTDLSEQLQQKIEMIGKLREEVDVIRTESLRWKEDMDRFATKKETARAQLSTSETQL
ncbi:uncharacterized protein [Nicotiana tomentosiformis]|uniref:uncharacterized protein isoform X2 n=1 Tax=Nicotiana tomentosiformis TaxID=4098 RepID=UPI00388C4A87